MARILVIAEHDNDFLSPSTLTTISAGTQLNPTVEVLVAGSNCEKVVETLTQVAGVMQVHYCNHPCFAQPLAEDLTALLISMAQDYSHILAPATTFGKNCLPRLAALLDVAPISDVIAIVDEKTFERPIYAGNAIATVQSQDKIVVMTVRTTTFEAAGLQSIAVTVNPLAFTSTNALSEFVGQDNHLSERPELTSAKIIISGGRGLQNAEQFKIIEKLADRLKAAVGASRAAVDAGFVPNDYQVGQTGKVVAPDLYIAIGISGAIQHLAGIKDSKIIVAINKDPDAPIFEVADYGLVADFFAILPELENALNKLGYGEK